VALEELTLAETYARNQAEVLGALGNFYHAHGSIVLGVEEGEVVVVQEV